MKVINKIAPSKEIRIKNNNQDSLDREVSDLILVQEKLFLKFKKSKLHIDEEIYKKIRNQVQKLIKKKSKISMKITLSKKKKKKKKPKELWKILKSMGLPSKAASASNICLKDRNEIVFNDTKIAPFSKASFPILCKTWYLNYLLPQMFLLSLKWHRTMMISSLSTYILNFVKHLLKKY